MGGRSRWRGCVRTLAVDGLTLHCGVGILLGNGKILDARCRSEYSNIECSI